MTACDLIFKNADVITMDGARPISEMVAVKDGIIQTVGDAKELESVKGKKTKVIDCGGKTIVPGFNDAHCHFFSFLRKLRSIDLSPSSVGSIKDIKSALKGRANNTPPGEWLIGTDYNEFYLAERRHPNRRDLDEVSPDHPVALIHRSLHACVLNSRGLLLAGVATDTEAPSGGLIDRDTESGEPTGVLFEMLRYIREKVLPPLSDAELNEGAKAADQHYLSLGITSLQEATVSNDFSRWQTLKKLKKSGKLNSRISMMLGFKALKQFKEAGLTFGAGDDHLRLGAVKILLDEASGDLNPPQVELNNQVLAAHKAGFQIAIHCVEASTVAAALTALEKLPSSERRHRLEHCSECPPEVFKRLVALKPVVVTQPSFLYYSGERYLATIPEPRLKWLYRIGSFVGGGLVVGGSSDNPVVPDNPLVGIYAAVTRKAESGEELLPEERLSVESALKLYTVNAAYASFEEKIKGSISPGKLADMVVLSANPLKVPPERIKDIRVEMTVIDGKVVWPA